jgi:hypothetical protein
MLIRVALVMLIFSVHNGLISGQGDQEAKAKEPKPPGISLSISSDRSVIQSGGDLLVKITLVNTSSHEIFIETEKGPDTRFGVELDIRTESGEQAKDTKEGHMRKRDISADPETGKPVIFNSSPGPQIHLQPGKSLSETLDIAKLNDMHQPGKYTIRVTRPDTSEAINDQDFRQWPIVSSNALNITVTP